MCVCVCVCLCVCVCVLTLLPGCVCLCVCVFACICTCVSVCKREKVCVELLLLHCLSCCCDSPVWGCHTYPEAHHFTGGRGMEGGGAVEKVKRGTLALGIPVTLPVMSTIAGCC